MQYGMQTKTCSVNWTCKLIFFFRFENFKQEPLSFFNVLDFNQWPVEKEELAAFGKDDLRKLVEYFSHCLPVENQQLIRDQFTELKAHLIKCRSKDLFEVCDTC